jgi:hypothetical protein
MSEESVAGSEPAFGHVGENPAARWRGLIDRQRSSGQAVSAFCREQGITPSSLYAWRRRLAGGFQLQTDGRLLVLQLSPLGGVFLIADLAFDPQVEQGLELRFDLPVSINPSIGRWSFRCL